MRNFDFKRYTPRPKKLLRASLNVIIRRFIFKVCFFVSHLGRGKAAQDKAVSKSFSQDANTGQVTSGSQFTQSKHKNVYKFTAPPVNPNPITDYVLLCTSL